MKAPMLTIAVCLGLLMAGCGGDDSSSDTASNGATEAASTTADQSESSPDQSESSPEAIVNSPDFEPNAEGAEPDPQTGKRPEPVIEVPDEPAPKELVVTDIEEGDGAEVKEGEEIFVDYVGVFYKDGKEFESSWAGNAQEAFVKGNGILIDGWEEGVEGMKVGGRRELIIPSELGYNTGVLIYVVDLLKVAPPRGGSPPSGGRGSSSGK